MIYYIQTNLDKTISNVSKKYKQGYATIDVPNVWVERFLNNFNDFWVDSNNVLHKPGGLKPGAEITTRELKEGLEEANNEINNIKLSTADASSAFSNALNYKADKEAINSVRDTLIAANSKLETLSDMATKEELSELSSKVKSSYTPLAESLAQLNSTTESKADIKSLSNFVTRADFSSADNSLVDNISNGLSSLDSKKADSTEIGSLETNLNNKVNLKANQSELAQLSSTVNSKATTDYVDSRFTSFENSVSIANSSNTLVLNGKATIQYVDDKSHILLSSLGSLDSKTADSSSLKSLADNFSLSNSEIRTELAKKADLENVKSANDTLLNSINQINNNKVNVEALESVRGNLQDQINTFNDEGSGVVKNVGALQEEIKGKANQHDLDTISSAVDDKVGKAEFDLNLNRKADKSTLDEEVNSLSNNINLKASKDDLDIVKGTIDQFGNKLNSETSNSNSLLNSLSSSANGRIQSLALSGSSDIAYIKNDINNKLSKDDFDNYSSAVSYQFESGHANYIGLINDNNTKLNSLSDKQTSDVNELKDKNDELSTIAGLSILKANSAEKNIVGMSENIEQKNSATRSLINSNADRIAAQETKLSSINNTTDNKIETLRSDLSSLASKPSVSTPSNSYPDLSSYVTKEEADRIAQQKMEQVYNNLNDKIDKIMNVAKPAFDMYYSSVATSNSIAKSIADSVAAANSLALSSSYPYVGKPFFMIGNEKVTKNQGYKSDMTIYGKVKVPDLDIDKDQTITISFQSASHTFPGLGMYENGGSTEQTITFVTDKLRGGLTIPWSSNSKNSELSIVDNDTLLFKAFDGTYTTRISGDGAAKSTYYAVIKSIIVKNN